MLADYQQLVTELVRDDAGRIQVAERDRAIVLAVERYSSDRPRAAVEDVAATGANTLPLPLTFDADFSSLSGLEYPIGRVPPAVLSQDRYGFYRAPAGVVIQLLDAVAVGAQVRAAFTVKHVVSAVTDTIPVGNREAVACWAAAALCDELASLYSGQTDATIQADSVDSRSRAQEYAARAKSLRTRYMNELGIADKRSEPAGVVVPLELPASDGGPKLRPLLHRRVW